MGMDINLGQRHRDQPEFFDPLLEFRVWLWTQGKEMSFNLTLSIGGSKSLDGRYQ
jgi:hypothetical protein